MMGGLAFIRRAALPVSAVLLLTGCISTTPSPTATATRPGPLPTHTIAIYPATLTPASDTPAATLPVLSPPPTWPLVSTPAASQPAGPGVPTPGTTNAPPAITSFTSDRVVVDPGGKVTLSWSSQGGSAAEITASFYRSGSAERLEERHAVPASGTLAIKMPDTPVRLAIFTLQISTPTNEYSNRSVFARSPCVAHYFFPFPASWSGSEYDNCPDQGATTVQAVQQDFEHGRMIWLSPDVSADGQPRIAVLMGSGVQPTPITYCLYTDTWQPGEPEKDPSITPPDGLHQPVRGFGKLWRESLRDQLGWALAPEQSYFAQYQAVDVAWSPHKDSYIYIGTADNRTALIRCVRLSMHWRYVPAQ